MSLLQIPSPQPIPHRKLILAFILLAPCTALAQQPTAYAPTPLDPTRSITNPILESSIHKPLPEEYIWTAGENPGPETISLRAPRATDPAPARYFRTHFQLTTPPAAATLYIAGPGSVSVWLNGTLVGHNEADPNSLLRMTVFTFDVVHQLKPGTNVIAIQATRGLGIDSGRTLVAKIVPAAQSVNADAILLTNPTWKSSTTASNSWQQAAFDDSAWKPAQSLGGIESSIDLFQWNADAGMYAWPGYDGISPFLAHTPITATRILSQYAARGSFDGLASLTTGTGDLTVHMPSSTLTAAEAPSLTLDFGRELTGRVEIISDSNTPVTLSVQVGESEPETLKSPFLGINQLILAPHATGYGPKSSFRYARLNFLSGPPELHIKAIRVDHIYYPVTYSGSFESSDPLLNRIWETGAYTTHLCMQDDLWDAPKRDRGRWMGDTDVSGRVVADVFGDRTLMEDTLNRLLGSTPVAEQVNGIPGYSAFWFTGVADYYRHTGSRDFLESTHARMLQLLTLVDHEFDTRNIYSNPANVWLYVDWSPELNGDTPETRRATTLEFYRAYQEAVFLLRELNDTANVTKYEARAASIKAAAQQYLLDPATNTFGPRWQTNAAAVISNAPTPAQRDAIWNSVLSNVGKGPTNGLIITPYYNYYVIRAMAELNHRPEALAWIRQFWGGMIAEGATSFWEAYDPSWYKDDFHASLQADNRSGYFVSLAHGWSTGPTAWLMEQVLGINPTGAGFRTVDIRPDLAGLEWARGAEPTPHGLLKVDIRKNTISIDVPEGVTARALIPISSPNAQVTLNGQPATSTPVENNTRAAVTLDHPGHYELTTK